MEVIATVVDALYFSLPDWASFLFFFVTPYLLIGVMVRSILLAILLGALAGVSFLSFLWTDLLPFEEISLQLVWIAAGYGAILSSGTAVLRQFIWKHVVRPAWGHGAPACVVDTEVTPGVVSQR